jgi:hypothetical protein
VLAGFPESVDLQRHLSQWCDRSRAQGNRFFKLRSHRGHSFFGSHNALGGQTGPTAGLSGGVLGCTGLPSCPRGLRGHRFFGVLAFFGEGSYFCLALSNEGSQPSDSGVVRSDGFLRLDAE